jgi:hypothetical protein
MRASLHASWLLSAALAGTLAQACADEPKPSCMTLSTLSYATKLIETHRDGSCDDYSIDGFNADPELGVSSYFERNAKGEPNYHLGSVAVQSAELGTLLSTAQSYGGDNKVSDNIYSLGKFSAGQPDEQNFCPAPSLSSAHLVLDAIPAMPDDPSTEAKDPFPGQPALDITLEWSDFKVYLTPASVGSQVGGHLKDTRKAPDGSSCTVEYDALGLAPAIPCKKLDDKGDPVLTSDGKFMTDEELCNPDADPAAGRFTGSGLAVDVAYECDPKLFFCVVKGTKIPSLK